MSEQNNKGKKIVIGAIVAAVLVAAAVIAIVLFLRKEKTYRSIRVLDVTGEVTIKREGKKTDAYESMRLLSGDKAITEEKSELELRLDEDKFIILRENSELRLEAAGTAKDSRTRLHLEYGEVYSDIENKLSEESVYDVLIPGASMSVRGTKFTVYYRDSLLKVDVTEGVVRVKLEDSEEAIFLSAGESMEHRMEDGKQPEDETLPDNTNDNNTSDNDPKNDEPEEGNPADKIVLEDTTKDLGIDDGWRAAYRNWFTRNMESLQGLHPRFTLIYIDDNDIPELLVARDRDGNRGLMLYRYAGNGNMAFNLEIVFNPNREFIYFPKKNLVEERRNLENDITVSWFFSITEMSGKDVRLLVKSGDGENANCTIDNSYKVDFAEYTRMMEELYTLGGTPSKVIYEEMDELTEENIMNRLSE